MLATIDLTRRQTTRVLEQALRLRARIELECRCREGTLAATLLERQQDVLCADLQDDARDWPLTGLIGAFCDVQTVLSGERYVFSTCIVDALGTRVPPRLLLAVPEVVQVANRRRFDRLAPNEQVMVQLSIAGVAQPVFGLLNVISVRGLSCRAPRNECDNVLLIDDELRVCFQLPGESAFELPAILCAKTPTSDSAFLDLGLEFSVTPQLAPTLSRLRAALSQGYTWSSNAEGQP